MATTKVRIQSDGTPNGTSITDAETGATILATSCVIDIQVEKIPKAVVTVIFPKIDVVAEATIVKESVSTRHKVNMNDEVELTINETGKKIWQDYYLEIYRSAPALRARPIPDVPKRMQLWKVMQIFG